MNKLSFSFRKNIKTLLPWISQKNIKQITIDKGNSSYIYSNGKRIIDFTSGLMVNNLGHNNKYIQEGFNIYNQKGIAFIPATFSNYERDKLSDRLIDITNFNNGKVFYTNAGAEANEVAMFILNEIQDKRRILSFKKSYHGGSSIASSILSGDNRKKTKEKLYNTTFESILNNPSMEDNGKSSLEQIDKLLNGEDIAGIMVEGSSGSAGCILYPDKYLERLGEICKKKNKLIICDEVMSGWGRTGELFAHQNKNFIPDIITTAKGITSGYSQLGAVIVNETISKYYDENPILSGLTYFGHPLPCTIANRCLDLYLESDMKIIKEVNSKSSIMRECGKDIEKNCDIVVDYRNNGLLGCIEISDNLLLKEINSRFLEEGIFCYMRESKIFNAPPLIIKDEEIIENMKKMKKILNTY